MFRPPRVVLASLGVLSVFVALLFAAGLLFPDFSLFRAFGPSSRETVLLGELAAIDRSLTAPADQFSADSVLKALGRLENANAGVSARLSILKRYRALAHRDQGLQRLYREQALRASDLFPQSQSLAAVALDSLLGKDWGSRQALEPEDIRIVSGLASRLEDPVYDPLRLYVRLRAGTFSAPDSALAAPDAEPLLASVSSVSLPGAAPSARSASWPDAFAAALRRDRLLLLLLGGDRMGALAGLEDERAGGEEKPNSVAEFAAEVHYDFGDPREAAALFGLFSDGYSLFRRADALVLAGELPSARSLWSTLAEMLRGETLRVETLRVETLRGETLRVQALYNLARTTQDRGAIQQWTTALLALDPDHEPGRILHSRTMDDIQAAGFLSRSDVARSDSAGAVESGSTDSALLSLEALRRASPGQEARKTVAQIWLLLEKHPQDGRLFQWGAYYFQTMAFYDELRRLLDMAALYGQSGDQAAWIDLHEGLEAMRLGRLGPAEQRLASSYGRGADWRVPANLGRIKESLLSMDRALELYGSAIALGRADQATGGIALAGQGSRASAEDLSILHQRLARCYAALGRTVDARRALESAVELDGDNREARLELRKM